MNKDNDICEAKFIDVEDIIKSKNATLHFLLPGFVIRFFKRFLHEDELNGAIYRNRDKFGLDFVDEILKEFGVHISSLNLENLPFEGRFTVASNHPLGGLDGMALMKIVGERRKSIKFIVNDLLLNLENLRILFLPVNKVGSTSRESAILIDEAYKSDNLILTFPFGLVSRKNRGKIQDLEWKKNFLTKSRITKRSIIPVYINGKNSNHFYFVANLRKLFKIKVNIEMLFLVDEMYRQNNKKIQIIFGRPILIEKLDKKYSDSEWAEKIRQYVYRLKDNPEMEFIYA